MSLSLVKAGGRLIARVKGGKYNGKLIYVDENEDDGYDEISAPKDGKIVPIIDTDFGSLIYVAGIKGSGKSHFTSQWCQNAIKEFYPNDRVFLVTPVNNKADDECFKGLNPLRCDLEAVEALFSLTPKDFEDSFVIFDDWDSIQNGYAAAAIMKLIEKLLGLARQENIKMVITNHQISDYKRTKYILSEANAVVLYPKSGDTGAIKDYLSKKMGLEKPVVKKILSIKDRWLLISKRYPMYVLTESEIFIIKRC
jgi:hypothetical protein